MTSRSEAKLNMYRTVKQLCDDNTTTLALNAAFLDSFHMFTSTLSTLIATVTSERQVIIGITMDKKMLKQNLSQTAADIAALVFAYASATHNYTLRQTVKYAVSDLFKIKDDILPLVCQNIYNAINENSAVLVNYGITPNMLNTFQSAITDYSNAVPKTRTAQSVKTTYTNNIRLLMKDLDTILNEQLDKLIISFKPNNPDFYHSYTIARKIIDPSSTPTQLKGTITDSVTKLPLPGVVVNILGATQVSLLSDPLGRYALKPIQAGMYKITVSKEGYTSMIIESLPVKLGQKTKQNFSLTAV